MRTSTTTRLPAPCPSARPVSSGPRGPAGAWPGRAGLRLPARRPAAGWDDATWLARIRGGDEDAARALVERLQPTILKSVRQHRPRRTSEEDLVQAVLVKVFHKLEQFSGLVLLEHWVSRIAVNTCLNQLKRETARPELRMGDLSAEEEAVVQHQAVSDEAPPGERQMAARELLETLMARLSPDQRLVVKWLHLDERSLEEISRHTGWSVSLVKVKAFRARRKMRRLWQSLLKGQRL